MNEQFTGNMTESQYGVYDQIHIIFPCNIYGSFTLQNYRLPVLSHSQCLHYVC